MAVLTMSLNAPATAPIAGDILPGMTGPGPNYGAGMPAISLPISNAGSTGSGLLRPIIEWELLTDKNPKGFPGQGYLLQICRVLPTPGVAAPCKVVLIED